MRKHSGFYSGKLDMEIGSNIDLSLLRRPLTPFTGFQEARNAFDKGTKEVRHLLLYECGLIYECNVCRNMFRSLANFISHKRVFCCTFASTDGTHNSTNGTDGLQSPKQQTCDYMLSKHDLRQKMHKAENDLSRHGSNEQINAINADETNNQILENSNQNQKATRAEERRSVADSSKPTEQTNCQSLEYVFQCPSCSMTFQKSSTVLRHLAGTHNIPIRRIRMMRDSLLKCAAKPIDKVIEKPLTVKENRELSGKESSNSSSVEEKKNAENDTDSSKCFFCHKSFERRATLIAHMQNCPIKTEVLEQSEEANSAVLNDEPVKEERKSNEESIATDVDVELKQQENQLQSFGAETTTQEDEDVKRTFVNLEKQNFGTGLQTVTLDKLDVSANESTNASLVAENDTQEADKSEMKADESVAGSTGSTSTNEDGGSTTIKKRRMRPSNAQFCRCKICGKHFNALSNLRRHISMFHYRSRKFGCALCDYCAFRRYDIVNHLNFVHKLDTDSDTTAKDLVRVNDVKYTKDDMNDDIVLCTNEERIAAENSQQSFDAEGKSNENTETSKPVKRQRRRKIVNLEVVTKNPSVQLPNGNEVDFKRTRQKLKRSVSQIAEASISIKVSQKRPKRNRTKPANKDFVYDLNRCAKKDQATGSTGNPTAECETYQLRGSKRRNTIIAQFDQTPTVPAFEIIKVKHYDAIKGAARRACLMIVHQGLAASSTLPEIPAERPQMRPRLTSTQRSDSQAGPIIETTELESERFKTLPLCDDSYLEKIAKQSVGSFKIKPCLEQLQYHSSALDSLLQKVDSSKHLNGYARNSNQMSSVQSFHLKDDALFDATLLENGCNNNIPTYLTPEQAIPKTLSTPIRPQKRLPSLDRLTETINSLENFYNAQHKK